MTKKKKILIAVSVIVAVIICVAVGGYLVIRNMMRVNIEHPFDGDGKEYTVTFDSNGGSEVKSRTVRGGNPVVRPATPEKEGYFLIGWFKNDDLSEEWKFDVDRVRKDMTLYAGWQKKQEELPPTESLTYQLNESGNEYTVTGVGEETIIVIPEKYNGIPVTTIQGQYGKGAFARKAITSVVLPDGIVTIGTNTFSNCSALTEIKIGENSGLTTIGNNAFSGCGALQSVFIPAKVSQIGDSAFNNDGAINFTVAKENEVFRSENGHLIETATKTLIRGGQSEVVPDGVTSIAQAAFRRSTLTKIYIPASVNSIGNYFIADSGVSEIEFSGTEEEWNAITKGKSWNYGKQSVEVSFNAE